MRKPMDPEAGSSLVELLLVSAVVLVMLAGILTGVVFHQRQRQANLERQLATAACRNTLEELRAIDIALLPGMHGRGFDVPGQNGAPGGLTPIAGDPDGLPGSISVVSAIAFGGATLFQVTTRVDWQGAGPGSAVQFDALVGQRR